MGQQQLLLIVLGVIVVGIAVVAGINLFSSSHTESIKDELVSQCMAIGANAQQYYVKPSQMGGGNNAFDNSQGGLGYVIPIAMRYTTNCGSPTAVGYAGVPAANTYTITATPNLINGVRPFASVVCTVNPTSMNTVVNP